MSHNGGFFRNLVSSCGDTNSALFGSGSGTGGTAVRKGLRRLRFYMTRIALRFFGVRLERNPKRVAVHWTALASERNSWIDEYLSENPLNVLGEPIDTLERLRHAPSLSKAMLRKAAEATKTGRGTIERQTAGTTGNPTTVHLTKSDLTRMLWVRDYCLSDCGVRLGDREGRLWGRPQRGLLSRLKNWLMNRKVFFPSGPSAIDAVQQLAAYKPDYVYGYASLIYEAAKIIERYGIDPPDVKCVICTAESVLPSQKEFISRQFNAPVREEYGSTEFDIIAFECDQGHMHLVNPWLVVSTRGDEALITDISRTTVNLVQYELGDSLQLETSSCHRLGSREVIGAIDGRSMDRYAWVTLDKKFHALEFARAIDAYSIRHSDVLGFLVTQRGLGEFELSVDQMPTIGLDGLSHWVENHVKKELGYSVKVQASIRSSEPRINGKKSYFISMNIPGAD